jgi:hypothetical protein
MVVICMLLSPDVSNFVNMKFVSFLFIRIFLRFFLQIGLFYWVNWTPLKYEKET